MYRLRKKLLDTRAFLRLRKARRRKHYWIVTYDINSRPNKYFCWDYEKVWRWSVTPAQASRFHTREFAISEMENTSMSWQYSYAVHRVTI